MTSFLETVCVDYPSEKLIPLLDKAIVNINEYITGQKWEREKREHSDLLRYEARSWFGKWWHGAPGGYDLEAFFGDAAVQGKESLKEYFEFTKILAQSCDRVLLSAKNLKTITSWAS